MHSLSRLIKTIRFFFAIVILAFVVFGCSGSDNTPENIIIFIGDGMGVGHITAGHCAGNRL
jgi:hypothetical protein